MSDSWITVVVEADTLTAAVEKVRADYRVAQIGQQRKLGGGLVEVKYLPGPTDPTEEAMAPWTHAHAAAATAEGWDLFDSTGSGAGPWQIQSFDDGEPVDLGDDMVAWAAVRRQATPHARAALQFLAVRNPLEYVRILAWPTVIYGEWDYDTDTVRWGVDAHGKPAHDKEPA